MVKVRTVPIITASSGMTLVALPAWIWVIDSTAVSSGLFSREMMVCQPWAICTATITGSTPLCGWAAWAPLPRTVTLNSLLEAIIGPATTPKLPSAMPGQLCMPYTASIGKLLEQAVFDHAARAGAAFFGRLENQVDGAVEIAVRGQVVRRAQQHGGVAVVAAGVHLAGVARRVGKAVDFLHGQRVHVGAQADGARSNCRA